MTEATRETKLRALAKWVVDTLDDADREDAKGAAPAGWFAKVANSLIVGGVKLAGFELADLNPYIDEIAATRAADLTKNPS